MNTGIQKPIIKPTDWKTSGEGITYKEVCNDWTPFLPVYEAKMVSNHCKLLYM
jgi:hypothetical protein